MAKKLTPVKNLKGSVKAIKKAVKIVTSKKKASSQPTKKLSFTWRDLPVKRPATLPSLLSQLDSRAEELDEMKRPGESWAFTIFGNKSHQIFESLDLMLAKLRQYKIPERKNDARDMVDNIRFIRFGGKGVNTTKPLTDEEYEKQVGQYQAGRERTVRKRIKKRIAVEEEVRTTVKTVTGTRPKDNFAAMEGLLSSFKKIQAANEALEKKLAKLQKELKNVSSKSKTGGRTKTSKQKAKGKVASGGGSKKTSPTRPSKASKSNKKTGKVKTNVTSKAKKKAVPSKTKASKSPSKSKTGAKTKPASKRSTGKRSTSKRNRK